LTSVHVSQNARKAVHFVNSGNPVGSSLGKERFSSCLPFTVIRASLHGISVVLTQTDEQTEVD